MKKKSKKVTKKPVKPVKKPVVKKSRSFNMTIPEPCCCSAKVKKSKAQLAEEKGLKDIYESIVNKVNSFMEGYGKIRDIFHVVRGMAGDDDVVALVKKISGGDRDPEMFVLLAASILRVLESEMKDQDGIFDYTPPSDRDEDENDIVDEYNDDEEDDDDDDDDDDLDDLQLR